MADRRAAQRKLLLETNRGPPSLVDVSRAVTVGLGGAAVTAGWRAPQCPGPLPRGIAIALPRLPRLAQKFIFPADLPLQRLDSRSQRAKSADRARHCRGPIVAAGGPRSPPTTAWNWTVESRSGSVRRRNWPTDWPSPPAGVNRETGSLRRRDSLFLCVKPLAEALADLDVVGLTW